MLISIHNVVQKLSIYKLEIEILVHMVLRYFKTIVFFIIPNRQRIFGNFELDDV